MNVKLSKAQKVKVVSAGDIYKVMQQILLRENKLRRAQEHFWIIGLDGQKRILFIELLALGQQNRVNTNPPTAFRMAIYKLATQVIFAHNHPSGSTLVSKADKDLTEYLYKAGKFLQIDVIDHLVIAEKKYTSFADSGLMAEIQASGAWELVDRTKADLNEMKNAVLEEQAEKRKALEIAKKMKAAGMADSEIKKMTGLRLSDIKKL